MHIQYEEKMNKTKNSYGGREAKKSNVFNIMSSQIDFFSDEIYKNLI